MQVKVFSEKSWGPFTAEKLKSLGDNKYSVTLKFVEPEKLRGDFKDMRVSIKV